MSEQIHNDGIILIQQLNAIQTTVTDIQRKQDIQNVKLFGEEGGIENAQGRLPRLESAATNHEERITRIEGLLIKMAVYATIAGSLVSLAAEACVRLLFNHK